MENRSCDLRADQDQANWIRPATTTAPPMAHTTSNRSPCLENNASPTMAVIVMHRAKDGHRADQGCVRKHDHQQPDGRVGLIDPGHQGSEHYFGNENDQSQSNQDRAQRCGRKAGGHRRVFTVESLIARQEGGSQGALAEEPSEEVGHKEGKEIGTQQGIGTKQPTEYAFPDQAGHSADRGQ